MKRFDSILKASLALALPGLFGVGAFAETLLPTADTDSTLTLNNAKPPVVTKTAISASSGKSGSLFVSRTHRAFIQFNAADQLTAEGLTAADIASARLTIYFPSAAKAGQIDLHLVTQPWSEKFTGLKPEPAISIGVIGSVPAASVIAKQFVSFDVTSAVIGWLTTNGTDNGFALETPDGLANVTVGAKEGAGSGYPATLEIELIGLGGGGTPLTSIHEDGATGNIGIGTSAPASLLDVTMSGSPVSLGASIASSINLALTNADQSGTVQSPDYAGLSFGKPGTPREAIVGGTFDSDDLLFFTGADFVNPKFTIAGSGNVGIGTRIPIHPLDINVGIDDVRIAGSENLGATGLILENTDTSTQDWYVAAGDNRGTFGPSKGFVIFDVNAFATRLAIDTSGNVGIGTNAAEDALHVALPSTSDPGGTRMLVSAADSGYAGYRQRNSRHEYFTGIGTGSDFWELYDNTVSTPRVVVASNGNVGIGTTNPTKGLLDVEGNVQRAGSNNASNFVGPTSTIEGPPDHGGATSIFASDAIVGASFLAISDARIKNIEGRSESAADLQKLLQIEVTDYRYKDIVEKGNRPTKKVIAQQVEKIFPQAVNRHTDVVPDIYQKASIKNGWVSLETDLRVGERVRLIGEKEESIQEVLEIKAGAFRTTFRPRSEEVFVYGREVNDFRTVDYDAISMLNVSATQELAKKLEARESELAALRAANEALAKRLATLEAAASPRQARDDASHSTRAQKHSAHPLAAR